MTVTVIVDDSDPDIHYDNPSADLGLKPDTNSMLLSAAIGNTLHNISGFFIYGFRGLLSQIYKILQNISD